VADELTRLVAFAQALRDEGLAVGPGRVVEFCRAGALLPANDLYWAGRLTLVSRPEEIPVYDRVFYGEFDEQPRVAPIRIIEEEVALASPRELLRTKSFARLTEEELAEVAELMKLVRLRVPTRRTRRREASGAGAPDLRRTLRRAFRTGGEPVERAWRRRRRRQRRLVLLLDVSGSMADYSRALVLFAHAALRTDARWEAFCFGTRLTRVTRALARADTKEALRSAAEEVVDWNGGTRIGDSVRALSRTNAVRGALVVICSDGLDVGEPDLLRDEMARLSRLAHRVVWLNPLKEDPAYEPLARGMRAALPHVDAFLSGHNLASLETLGRELLTSRRVRQI
jgi:uncharacterized protein with von Willebrand factor type A (vWA) domain